MSEVPRESDGLDARVVVVEVAQDVGRAVRAAVVDEDDLEVQPLAFEDTYETLVELRDVALLVQDRDHHGEQHGGRIIVRVRGGNRRIRPWRNARSSLCRDCSSASAPP